MRNNNKPKIFKNKFQLIVYPIIMIGVIGAFIYLGNKNYKITLSDSNKFNSEYSMVPKENVFKYVNASSVYEIARGRKGIVLIGNKNNLWAGNYAKIINEVAKEYNISEIFYYDITDDRKENNGTYELIVQSLSDYVKVSDTGKKDLYAPTLLIVGSNEVLLFDDETSFNRGNINVNNYWDEEQIAIKKNDLRNAFSAYLAN